MAETKLVYLLWAPTSWEKQRLRETLIEELAPELLEAGARRLQINVDDELADVPSPAPKVLFEEPIRALVGLWVDDVDLRHPCEDLLRHAGFELAGYLVEEQIYTEYGGNEHASARDWPDGRRSPGIVAVTLMERPKRLGYAEWVRRWHGRQSPLSEAMQPRSRYVRNVVMEAVTAGAPPFEGIVEESYPSAKHITNPFLFYGAKNPLQLVKNMAVMLHSVVSFLDLWRIRTITMSEYFLRS